MSTSRETVRDALAVRLAAALGVDVTVTNAKVDTLKGVCPLVTVLGGGTFRERFTGEGDRPMFRLVVQVWVPMATGTWTNLMAEDKLDDIEKLIAGDIEASRNVADWDVVEYEGFSEVRETVVDGISYYLENIPVLVVLNKS